MFMTRYSFDSNFFLIFYESEMCATHVRLDLTGFDSWLAISWLEKSEKSKR